MINELSERINEPVRVLLDLLADHIAAEADEAVGGRTALQVGGAIAHHEHAAVAVGLLEVIYYSALAARLGGELGLAEARVLARLVELERVCEDARARHAQPVRHRVYDEAETARDQVDGRVARVQQLDELGYARRQAGRAARRRQLVELVDDAQRGTDHGEAQAERLAERHVAAHCLQGPFKKIKEIRTKRELK